MSTNSTTILKPPSNPRYEERVGERGLRTGEGGGTARHDAGDAGAVVVFAGMAWGNDAAK